MKFPLRQIWRFVRRSRVTLYLLLFVAPMSIKPLGFVKRPERSTPIYGSLPELMGAPVVVGHLICDGIWRIYTVLSRRQLEHSDSGSPADFLRALDDQQPIKTYILLATVGALYAIAVARWLYHRSAYHTMKRRWEGMQQAPLKYFVVHTAAWGFWSSLFLILLSQGLQMSNGDFRSYVDEQAALYGDLAAASVLAIVLILIFARRTTLRGMVEVYGSVTRQRWVDGVGAALLLAILAGLGGLCLFGI